MRCRRFQKLNFATTLLDYLRQRDVRLLWDPPFDKYDYTEELARYVESSDNLTWVMRLRREGQLSAMVQRLEASGQGAQVPKHVALACTTWSALGLVVLSFVAWSALGLAVLSSVAHLASYCSGQRRRVDGGLRCCGGTERARRGAGQAPELARQGARLCRSALPRAARCMR